MGNCAQLTSVIGVFVLTSIFAAEANAHSGGLDARGCHHDRKRGGYHCHSSPSAPSAVLAQLQPALPPAKGTATQSDEIRRIQSILTDYGDYAGPIDGVMNLEMNMAIMRFKNSRHLHFDTFSISETLLVLDRHASKDSATLPRPQKAVTPLPPSTDCLEARALAETYERSAKDNRADGFAAGFRAAIQLNGATTDKPLEVIAAKVAKACQP